jgi:acyl dehydratase
VSSVSPSTEVVEQRQARQLEHAPGMLGLFAKAGAGMIPVVSRLPVIGGTRGKNVPEQTLTLRTTTDRDRLVAYDRVCGFGLKDTLPATYPHMLAFPLHLALLTDPKFPFPAIGLVHIANRLTQYRPIDAQEAIDLTVWATPIYPHPKGRQFMIRTEARVGGELVWEEASTNLRIGKPNEGAQAPTLATAKELPATATWKLPGDLGRRYASVSGDFNPIHIHPLSARLFGFPSAIAHGMWTKARCLAALESTLPPAFTVEVAFKRPILLPAKVEFAEATTDGTTAFGVRDARKGTPHLDGLLSNADA